MTHEARAFTTGCAGLRLSADERAFMRAYRPWGLILFGRNIQDRDQLRALVAEFRELVGREDAPVLIDQEGGRVQRLKPPEWRKRPAAGGYRTAAGLTLPERADVVRMGARLIAADLTEIGVSVNCMPVLDVPAAGSHDIVGDRAYGDDPATVAVLGRAACEGLLAGGVLPVVKHTPGHGRARADSHLALPVVDAARADLEAVDFAPFRALADMPIAMTAHVVFTDIDPHRPATVSPRVVEEVIRGWIGFDGLLLSDDLSMKALEGSFTDKTRALFAAGLDIALYCWDVLADAEEVARASPVLDGRAAERAAAAFDRLRRESAAAGPFDPVDAEARLQSALAMAG